MNYLQDGQLGSVSFIGEAYEEARDQGLELVPEGAQVLSYMVERNL